MNILVGKTIEAVQMAADKKAMLFKTDAGDVLVRVDADCCSETWIEHIELPALGFPAKVLEAVDLDLNKTEQSEEFDCLQYYGFKITTDRGEMIIDYRNSSNGYYGGSLSWSDDGYYYGGVYGQNVSKDEWTAVT